MRHLSALLLLLLLACGATAMTLESARLRAEIDDATGVVTSLVDLSDHTTLLRSSPDRYALQSDPQTEIDASEADDRTAPTERRGVLVATNPKLPGITITKSYTLTDRWLAKRVEFKADREDIGLLKYTVTTTADPAFYRDGYLNDPSRHPIDYPYIYTRDLTGERPIRDSHAVADHHWAIFTNPALNRGLAQYRLRVDDRYVHPLSSYAYEPGLTYGPQGWRVAVACKWMSSDRPTLSAECRWHLFDGDQIAFQKEYLALPECRAEWDWDTPDWLREVKGIVGWSYGGSSFNLDRFRDYIEAYDGGYLLVMIGGVFHNTRAYLDDPLITPDGLAMKPVELRRLVDGLHAISPRLKVGPITWQWGFGELDPVFREHPEWTVHDGDGNPLFAATGWGHERVYSQLLTPACRKHNLEQFRGMVERYDFDFIYMDTGQGGVTRFDWNTKYGSQDYDWADFYQGIRDAARSHNNGVTFFNGTPRLYSQYADCGYFEGMSFVKVRAWQAMADRLLLVKLYQPGEKWTMPLYWRDNNTEEYINYCYLLGLKPGGFGGGVSLRRWPLVAAANELATSRLCVEAEARPCWWKEQTDVECYALTIPGGGMLNAYQHGQEAAEVVTSCAVEPFGLVPTKPVQAWLFRPRAAAEVTESVRITETEANAIYRREGNAADRVMQAIYLGAQTPADGRVEVRYELGPGQVGLVLLTQSRQLACAVEGKPTQFLLPAPEGRDSRTIAADRAVPADLVARRYAYRVPDDLRSPLLIPQRSTVESVNRTIIEVGRTVAGARIVRLLTIDCDHNREDAATAAIEGDTVKLVADMGAEKLYGFASAAVEATNLGKVRFRTALAEPLYKRFATNATQAFVGFTADYQTAGKYTRRVRFALAPCRADALTATRPWWGAYTDLGRAPDPLFVDLTDRVAPGGEAELEIDLGRYAPDGWNGTVLFGPVLESCGLGARLEVDILSNAPPGPRGERPFSPLPVAREPGGGVAFQGAAIARFEDGAELRGEAIVFPPNGCIEAAGLRVLTWRVKRGPGSTNATLMINYQLEDGSSKLVYRDLGAYVKAGSEGQFDIDLTQYAPEGWNGRVRMRVRGDELETALVGNNPFQLF